MKTTTIEAAAPLPLPLPLPLRGSARLRRLCEWLVSAAVAGFGVFLILD